MAALIGPPPNELVGRSKTTEQYLDPNTKHPTSVSDFVLASTRDLANLEFLSIGPWTGVLYIAQGPNPPAENHF